MIERNFPVVDANISIDRLASILSEILGVTLKANGTINPGTGIKTQVHTLMPVNPNGHFFVSIRNYAMDPNLKRREIGVMVKGDTHYEKLFGQNLGPLLEYFI